MARIKVDTETLSRAVSSFKPRGSSVELIDADCKNIREQLALHLAHVLQDECGMPVDDAERWYSVTMSPYVAERVEPS